MQKEIARMLTLILLSVAFLFPISAEEEQVSTKEEQVSAEEEQERPDSDGWEFLVVPYLWMIGVDADVEIGRAKASADLDFSDILDTLEFGAMGYVEARKNRWAFFFDGLYLNVEDEFRRRLVKADVSVELGMAEFGALYRFGKPKLSTERVSL